ncbi:hypothetical protein SRABI76_01946 [Microbacterium oxydans]|uniref:Uncharacterized protein n=1 Tax=Microbacterium oxydans TaxID=82380 RepID=A0A0F0LAE4_9MICO|nr:hypothetical protein [Microbacterium oxydans]KJL29235.1 hypothetical protein RS83_01862 [Microbacterium oxydans]CAH0198133.1 hypothetical protein SRABI76_01946 [Microbacterium oxydans]
MATWSNDNQSEAVRARVDEVGVDGQWVVSHDENTDGWAPDGNAAVI